LSGEGELVRVRFRVKAEGDPAIALRSVEGRDAANRKIAIGPAGGPAPVPAILPLRTELAAAYPNPFARSITFEIALRQTVEAKLQVYDVKGRHVRTVVDGLEAAGRRSVVWDGEDESGHAVASGVYLVRFRAGEIIQSKTVQLLR
jgi:hypothetical protein